MLTDAGALVIKNAQRSDEGSYKCVVENKYGRVESPLAIVKLLCELVYTFLNILTITIFDKKCSVKAIC